MVEMRAIALLLCGVALRAQAQIPCEEEIRSACPDRPGPEVAGCLKDEREHETKTSISSECTDFIALNVACNGDIRTHCEDAFFSGDTILCLTSWTDQASISDKCASVMKWAIPSKEEDEDAEGATDELGLSKKDYDEKKAWQAARKQGRTAAIEKMKTNDRQKEEDRKEMERLKRESPEEYKQVMAEREFEFKRNEEDKKKHRQREAAMERQRREDAGEPEEDPIEVEKREKREKRARERRAARKGKGPWLKENWLMVVLGSLACLYVIMNVINLFSKDKDKDDDDKDD